MKLNRSKAKNLSLAAAILLAIAMSQPSQAQIAYTVQNLGTLPGGLWSIATGINNCGNVIGFAGGNNYTHAVVWHGGVIQDINTLDNVESYALGINDKGQIAGWASSPVPPFYEHPFVWDKTNGMRDIGLPPYGLYGDAYGINNAGQVVGESNVGAFMYDGAMHNLLGWNSSAKAINNVGQIVGSSWIKDGSEHAVMWQNGTMTDLGALYYNPGTSPHTRSYANDINDSGQIVGQSDSNKSGFEHAFIYDNGTMTDLGTLGGDDSNAMSINSQGQIVGWSLTTFDYIHAFLNDSSGMHDLNDLIPAGSGWELFSAYAINDREQIVGRGSHGAFLLTPLGGGTGVEPSAVPEPTAMAFLAGLAVPGIALALRRRIKLPVK